MISFWSLIVFITDVSSSTLFSRASYLVCKSSTSLEIVSRPRSEWSGLDCRGLLIDIVVWAAASTSDTVFVSCMN